MKNFLLLFVALTAMTLTNAQITSFPFEEDFEDFTACGAGGCNVDCSGAVANGWTQQINGVEDDQDWRVDAGGTGSTNTGPSQDHDPGTSTGHYLYTEASGCNNQIANLISPILDLSALGANAKVDFYYHMVGPDMGTLNVDITTDSGASWTNLWTQAGPVQLDETDPFQLAHIDITSYIGQNVQLRWQGITGPGFSSDMAIDAIKVYEVVDNDLGVLSVTIPDAPDCGFNGGVPISISIENPGINTQGAFNGIDVWFSITGPGGAQAEFENISATLVAGDTLDYTFNSLANISQNGEYTIMAWTDLPTDASNGNDTATLIFVNPAPITDFPWTEDFESFTTCSTGGGVQTCDVNNGWQQGENGVDDDNDWRTDAGGTTSTGTGPSDDNTLQNGTGQYMYIEASTTFNLTSNLISPCIDLDASPGLKLEFYYHMYGVDMGTLNVDITTDGGLSWTNLWTQSGQVQTASTDPWQMATVNLAGFSGVVQLRFQAIAGSNFDGDMAIDDIAIKELLPTDFEALTVSVDGHDCNLNTGQTITASFINIGTAAQSGFDVTYEIVPPVGAVISQTETVTANVASGDTLYYSFSTTADFSDIGFYTMRTWSSLAGDGDNSNDTSAPVTIEKAAFVGTFPYTESWENGPGGWTVTGTNSSWELGMPQNTVIDTAADGTNAWVTGLDSTYNLSEQSFLASPCFDFSGFAADPFVTFSINYQTENNFDEVYMESSIDGGVTWNRVGSAGTGTNWYNDATNQWWENSSGGWVTASNDLIGLAGESSVRLRFAFSADFSVVMEGVGIDNFTISPPLADDIAVLSIDAPTSQCGLGQETVTVTLQNQGTAQQSNFDISYSVNGGAAVTETFAGTLSAGVPATFSFNTPIDMSAGGNYAITVYTSLPSDSDNTNDTTMAEVINSQVNAFPWNEDFESFTGCTAANAPQNCDVANGWQQDANDDDDWRTDASGTASPNTGPSGDHTLGTGNYMYLETSGPVPGNVANLMTPCIELAGLAQPTLIFYYHMFGDSMGTLNVDVTIDDGISWTNVFTQSGQVQTSNAAAWEYASIDLSAYVSQTINIRFQGIAGGDFTSDIAIDDIYVGEFFVPTPDCFAPTVTVTNIDTFSAQINWTSNSPEPAFSYVIEYGPMGFTPDSGTVVNSIPGQDFITISGLMAGTAYDVYVAEHCAGNDTSDLSDLVSFVTICDTIPVGDSLADAIEVLTFPFSDVGNTSACFTDQNPARVSPDVFYKVTTGPCTDSLYISTCNGTTNFDTYVYLLDSAGNQIAFNDDATPGTCSFTLGGLNRFSIIHESVNPNTVYYVVVDGFGAGSEGTYQLDIEESTATPAGDSLEIAIPVSLPFNTVDSTEGCFNSYVTTTGTGEAPDIFYQFTTGPATTGLFISTCNATSDYDTYLHLLDSSGNVIAFNDDAATGTCSFTLSGLNRFSIIDVAVDANTTYYVVVDGFGSNAGTFELDIIEIADTLAINFDQINDVTCNGDSDGSIDVTMSGGVAPYFYQWNTGDTTEDLTGLAPGSYQLMVSDAAGNSTMATAVIANPDVLVLSATVTDATTIGGSDGAIDLTVTGGVFPYNFQWSNGATTEDVSGLTAGDYFMVMSDDNGCFAGTSATVGEPAATCAQPTNITKTVSGTQITFNWTNAPDAVLTQLQYRVKANQPGTVPDQGTRIINVPGSTRTITFDAANCGLFYQARLRHDCGGVLSNFSGVPVIATSPCAPPKEGQLENNMAIYPNPTDGIINLVIPAGKEAKAVISIINAVGKEVTRAEIAISEGSNITALDVSHLAAGVYSATVNMENQPQKTMPFVKQ